MKQNLYILSLVILLFGGCNLGASGVWNNEHIDKKISEAVRGLNDKLFGAIIRNDVESIRSYMSKKLLKVSGSEIDTLISKVYGIVESSEYRVLDEFYVSNTKTEINNTLPGYLGEGEYILNYLALNKEMYVIMFIPNEMENDILFTAIYGKYSDEWKLNILQFGQYSLLGKTAISYYTLAKESYKKKYLINAANYLTLSSNCMKPANDYLKYTKEPEIKKLSEQVMKEINAMYKFPITLDNINTKPKIFRIFPQMYIQDFYPMVCYISDVSFKDTVALKVENEKVKVEVGKIFNGIDKENSIVFYRVFKEIPLENKPYEYYGFSDQNEALYLK